MIEKYEKISGTGKDAIIEIVAKADATHLHKCYHDETPFKSCTRERIDGK